MPNGLSTKQLFAFYNLIKDRLGIHLDENKRDMIQAKIDKLMRRAGVTSYDEYLEFITNYDPRYWQTFVDLITVHKTNFFREDKHFNFIKDNVERLLRDNPRILRNREIRVWSSACSTGDEPYTIAMVLKEYLPPEINIKILATDVSSGVIEQAHQAEYELGSEDRVNSYFLNKYFIKSGEKHKIPESIKKLITFRVFNLMSPFPFKNNFDIIFCRNVMIYFDQNTQAELIKKFYNYLIPGGLLFIGHSESLTQKQYKFKYVMPTIYIRPE